MAPDVVRVKGPIGRVCDAITGREPSEGIVDFESPNAGWFAKRAVPEPDEEDDDGATNLVHPSWQFRGTLQLLSDDELEQYTSTLAVQFAVSNLLGWVHPPCLLTHRIYLKSKSLNSVLLLFYNPCTCTCKL